MYKYQTMTRGYYKKMDYTYKIFFNTETYQTKMSEFSDLKS